jgi:hypothetical protein
MICNVVTASFAVSYKAFQAAQLAQGKVSTMLAARSSSLGRATTCPGPRGARCASNCTPCGSTARSPGLPLLPSPVPAACLCTHLGLRSQGPSLCALEELPRHTQLDIMSESYATGTPGFCSGTAGHTMLLTCPSGMLHGAQSPPATCIRLCRPGAQSGRCCCGIGCSHPNATRMLLCRSTWPPAPSAAAPALSWAPSPVPAARLVTSPP